ncbi:MAG: DUF2797 domain-containing protein [Pseudomonadota bacterium]
MVLSGNLKKMESSLESEVHYTLPVGEERLALNPLIGKSLQISFDGTINCIACGRKTKKSYSQGHCYPCSQRLASCDLCIMKPETCHYDKGTCREPEWGEQHCMQPHFVYLSNTSGIKVGITRQTQIPTRWVDQGATEALPIFKVQTRLQSGLVEVMCKNHVADRTDWRRMLKGDGEPKDLKAVRDELLDLCAEELDGFRQRFGEESLQALPDAEMVKLRYPVEEHPQKVSALNLDKTPSIEATLLGIKGQYLIFDKGVLNVRKYTGYKVTVEA